MHPLKANTRFFDWMTPHVDDRFSGHMPEGDPRDLMFACGGCTPPSVMAHNFLVCSTNAWGSLSLLNTAGIPLIPNLPWGSSWEFWWKLGVGLPWIIIALMKKSYPYEGDNYRIELQATFAFGQIYSDTVFPAQTCNRDHALTPFTAGFPVPHGGSGDGVILKQVEWDQSRPPGGWPP